MNTLLFTPSAVLDLLTQVDELSDKDLELVETGSGIQLKVGESIYNIDGSYSTTIDVPKDVVTEVDEVNQEGYDAVESAGAENTAEPVQSGILSELAKSLLLGGMVRLSAKILKK